MVEKIAFNGDKRVGFWKQGGYGPPYIHPSTICIFALECSLENVKQKATLPLKQLFH